jgi:hypothetical protein
LIPSINGMMDKVFDAFKPAQVDSPDADREEQKKDPYDTAVLVERVLEFIKTADKTRWAFERLWFRSILYYLGSGSLVL